MALDRNDFDDFLKDAPWRDLAFRALVWLAISGAGAWLALHRGLSALHFLERVAASIAPLVNLVGTVAVFLAAPALAAKDLEFVAPDRWGQGARRGKLGGLARRLAGDLLLWSLGAFLTLLSAIVVAVAIEGIEDAAMAAVAGMVAKLAVVAAITAVLTIGVRRAGPSPLVELTTRIPWLLALYAGAVSVASFALMRNA